MKNLALLSLALAGVLFVRPLGGSASQTPQRPGAATGTLMVGAAQFQLSHAYAFPENAKGSYRIFVTDQPLTASALTFAASAGVDEEDRQQLVVELSDHEVRGVEAIVGPDKRVIRVNVYSPDSVLGMMLLEPTQFQATVFDTQTIAGKLFTEKPIRDARIGKTIQYEATFSAQIHRSTTR